MKPDPTPKSQTPLEEAGVATMRLIESSFHDEAKPRIITFDPAGNPSAAEVDARPCSIDCHLVSSWDLSCRVLSDIRNDQRVIWIFPQIATSSELVICGTATILPQPDGSKALVRTRFENRFRYRWRDGRELTIQLQDGGCDQDDRLYAA
ncbi:MAG: hypothetical protein ACI9R3_002952 [Verrucomicrobiales bacterium]|jgi:hypothetical protein